jgi:hypothetical protein
VRALGRVVLVDALCNLVLFAVVPLLIAIHPAESIGRYGVFQTVVGLAAIAATMRLELALRERRELSTGDAFRSIVVFGPVAAASAVAFYMVVARCGGMPAPGVLEAGLAAVGGFASGLFNYLGYRLVAEERTDVLSAARVVRVAVVVAGQVVVPTWLVAPAYGWLATSSVVAVCVAVALCVHLVPVTIPRGGLERAWTTIATNRALIAGNAPAALIFAAQDAALLAFVASSSMQAAGIFFIADRLLRTPVVVLNQSLRQFVVAGRLRLDRLRIVLVQGVLLVACAGFAWAVHAFVQPRATWLPDGWGEILEVVAALSFVYALQIGASLASSRAIRDGDDTVALLYACLCALSVASTIALHEVGGSRPLYVDYALCAGAAHLVFLGLAMAQPRHALRAPV